MKSSEKNKRYMWLIAQLEKEFSTKVIQEELSNNQPLLLLKESGQDFVVQILKAPQVSYWENGTWTDHYQVNLYITNHVSGPQDLAGKVKAFCRTTLSGTDAGDLFLNTGQSQCYNYWFRVLIQEGV